MLGVGCLVCLGLWLVCGWLFGWACEFVLGACLWWLIVTAGLGCVGCLVCVMFSVLSFEFDCVWVWGYIFDFSVIGLFEGFVYLECCLCVWICVGFGLLLD